MASGSITSLQIDGQKMETVTEFIFLVSKITTDGDCSHEIKRCLLLGRKAMTNLDSILQSRDITLPRKVLLVKAMVFPVVMCGCERWTIQKADRWRIDAFELWCWRRLLRIPWTTRRLNQSILKKSSLSVHWKDWCWSWSSNTLATWCREPTHWKRPWCWEKTEGRRIRGQERTGWLDGITDLMDVSLSKLQEMVKDREDWRAAVHGVTKNQHDWVTEEEEQQHLSYDVKTIRKALEKTPRNSWCSSGPDIPCLRTQNETKKRTLVVPEREEGAITRIFFCQSAFGKKGTVWSFTFLFLKNYLFMALLCLCYCSWTFSSCGEWGLLSNFSVVASLVEEHSL